MAIKSLMGGKKSAVTAKKSLTAAIRRIVEPAADAAIDFPKEGDRVMTGHYAVRISAKRGLDVEINTGATDWWKCREAVGFFWFDWWPAKPGRTTLSVRVKAGKGRWKKASERVCSVVAANKN